MLGATAERVPVIDEVVADKGFDGDAQRQACVDRDVFPNILNKANRVNRWPFDKRAYRGRNKVERLIGKAKQFRRFATRYEKLRTMYLGVVGVMFVLPVVAGAYPGRWLDSLYQGYSVRWTVSLILLGVAVGIANVYLLIRR